MRHHVISGTTGPWMSVTAQPPSQLLWFHVSPSCSLQAPPISCVESEQKRKGETEDLVRGGYMCVRGQSKAPAGRGPTSENCWRPSVCGGGSNASHCAGDGAPRGIKQMTENRGSRGKEGFLCVLDGLRGKGPFVWRTKRLAGDIQQRPGWRRTSATQCLPGICDIGRCRC